MINNQVSIALIIIEILLLAGFFGVIVAITKFSSQIKEQNENLFESVNGEILKLRAELRSYKDELDALIRQQREKHE